MTEFEGLKALSEFYYLKSLDTIVKDAKIMIGQTKEVGGNLIFHICAKKESALKHATKFVKKYKRSCYIFDFEFYPDKIKYVKAHFTNANLN